MAHPFFFISLLFLTGYTQALNILHLSAHKGCINEFKQVADELNIELTSYYLLQPEIFQQLTGHSNRSFDILNMTHEKAADIWERNKNIFNSFDGILVSDTTPLSRIFLQNNYKKPLIIWVCNRFDYHHETTARNFPDAAYYELMNTAITRNNVFIRHYTPYEYKYANKKNVNLGVSVIKPIGSMPKKNLSDSSSDSNSDSNVAPDVDKPNTIFISSVGSLVAYDNTDSTKTINYIAQECINRNIRVCKGSYNGPDDLIGIKGVLYFPYQASNLTLFEGIQRGIIHFVPSNKFLAMAAQSTNPHMPCKKTKHWLDSFDNSEWYLPENESLFVYFDSWDDLAYKVNTTNYSQKRNCILDLAHKHRTAMLNEWQRIFVQFPFING